MGPLASTKTHSGSQRVAASTMALVRFPRCARRFAFAAALLSVVATATTTHAQFAPTVGADGGAGGAPQPSGDSAPNAGVPHIAGSATDAPNAGGATVAPASVTAQTNDAPDGSPLAVRRLVVLDAAPLGVDPAAGAFVTGVLRTAAASAGWTIIPTAETYEAARRVGLEFPVAVDGFGTLVTELHAAGGLTADVRAGGGFYVVRVRVRRAGEARERTRDVVATQWTLGDSLRTVVPLLLSDEPRRVDEATYDVGAAVLPDLGDYRPPPPRRVARVHPQRFELSAGFEFAIGPSADSFFNFMLTARAAWFPFDRFGISLSAAYANLRGRTIGTGPMGLPMRQDARVGNVLFGFGLETAIEIAPRPLVYMPVRAELLYLPFNGPVLRATTGIAFGLSRTIRLEIDLLGVSVWFLPDAIPWTINLGAQIHFGVGGSNRARRPRRTEPGAATQEPPADASPTVRSTPTTP